MPLSNAERQRKWHEKQKRENREVFLEKERMRRKDRYIPSSELSKKDLEKRRDAVNKAVQRHYQRKREMAQKAVHNTSIDAPASSRTRSKCNDDAGSSPLIVKLKLPRRSIGVRKRHSAALRKAYRQLESLRSKTTILMRSNKKIQKRIERMRKKRELQANDTETKECENNLSLLTPRKKTKLQMQKSGLLGKHFRGLKKRLLMANALIEDVKSKRRDDLLRKLSCGIIKKYRCVSAFSREVGVSRPRVIRASYQRKVRKSIRNQIQTDVLQFLEREDNSITLPGKKDCKKADGEMKQKRILTDYLHNIHGKFLLENPNIKVSKSVFYKMKPAHILYANFSSRKTCLCTKHQNVALKIRCLRGFGIQAPKNPDIFIKEFKDNESVLLAIEEKCPGEIKFFNWKRVQDNEKIRWKEIEEKSSKEEFKEIMQRELSAFRDHVDRVTTQYREMKKLRENLPDGHALVWVDFAENYSCSSVEEIQSAYWNTSMITLHTMVVYYSSNHTKKLQSIVAVSDLIHHNATAVHTILKKTIPVIRADYPTLTTVHYLSDSPTSQYRNRYIFQFVAYHEQEFGIKARWDYLESGHGKGPCDGLGGSVKRSADMAVKQAKCNIQDAADFFAWGLQSESAGSKVKYLHYTQEDYDTTVAQMSERENALSVPGTMKLHAIVPSVQFPMSIYVRNVSCYCLSCMINVDSTHCTGWELHALSKQTDSTRDNNLQEGEQEATIDHGDVRPTIVPKENDFVATVYDKNWYVGRVTDIDENEVMINFMCRAGKYEDAFKWPAKKDEIWVDQTQILSILDEPVPHGKTKRCFKIPTEVFNHIEKEFASVKDKV